MQEQLVCHECGEYFSIDHDGIATHNEDHDADADHTPYDLD